MKNLFLAEFLFLPLVLSAADKPVFYSSLDTEQYLKVPQIGKPAIINREVRFGEGIKGGALHVREGEGSVAFPLPEGLPADSGLIEFAAKIDNDRSWYRDAGDPTFFSVFDEATATTMFMAFEINANNGIAKSGWYYRHTYLGWTTSLPNFGWHLDYRTCFGESDPKGWHTYQIRWNIEGLDGSADTVRVYMDDKQILSNQQKPSDVEGYRKRMRSPCRLYFAREFHEKGQNHSDYWIDEFKIWASDHPVKGDDPKANARKRVVKMKDGPELAAKKRQARELAAAEARRAAEAAKKLAPWATGTFVGGGDFGSVEFSLQETGELVGTYQTVDRKWALKAPTFTRNDLTNAVCEIAVEFVSDEETMVKPLVITPLSARGASFEAWMCEWETNPDWMAVAKKFAGKTCTVTEDDVAIKLDVKEKAVVDILLAAVGKTYESSTRLVPSSESDTEYRVFICIPCDNEGFKGYVGEFTLDINELGE